MSLALASLFGVLGLLRWCTTVGAIHWLRMHGSEYQTELRKCAATDLTGSKLRTIVEASGGGRVLPWGVLEYKLHDRGRARRFVACWVYRLPTLTIAALLAYLCLRHILIPDCSNIAWSLAATFFQVAVLLSAIEGVYSYVSIGGYRRYYHVGLRLRDSETPVAGDNLYELEVILPLGISALAANLLAFCVAQNTWQSFACQVPLNVCRTGELLLQGAYFVITSMSTVGYGDIVPHDLWAQTISILIHLQSLTLIIGLFATLISFGVRANGHE
jgi:hypothetical protein